MKVRAIEMGVWDGSRRRQGVVFDVEDGIKLPKWLEPVDTPPEKSKAKPGPKPKREAATFAEINQAATDSELQPWAAAKK